MSRLRSPPIMAPATKRLRFPGDVVNNLSPNRSFFRTLFGARFALPICWLFYRKILIIHELNGLNLDQTAIRRIIISATGIPLRKRIKEVFLSAKFQS